MIVCPLRGKGRLGEKTSPFEILGENWDKKRGGEQEKKVELIVLIGTAAREGEGNEGK